MKKLTQEQINKILEGHKHWLNEDCEGWETMREDFSYCELNQTDLSHTNLCGTNLCGANLSGAKKVPYIPMLCPEEGDFIGWKKQEIKL